MLRLDKYLADMQVGTRSEVKQMIRKGLVTVDGLIVKKPEEKVDCEKQVVVCSGAIVSYHQYEYYMLNKPAGVVSATEDPRDKTVIDLIEDRRRKDLFPAGRLIRIPKDFYSLQTMEHWRMIFCHRKSMWIRSIMPK